MKQFVMHLLIAFLLMGCNRMPIDVDTSGNIGYGKCLNQDTCFDNQVKKIVQYQLGVDFQMKKKMILSLMADYFYKNTLDTIIGSKYNMPPVIGVSFERNYFGYRIYHVFQSTLYRFDDPISSFEINGDHMILYQMDDEEILPSEQKPYLDFDNTLPPACFTYELIYCLAIKEHPFQYYAIANVVDEYHELQILDSLISL